jgi:two-component system, OmpR family, response regulator
MIDDRPLKRILYVDDEPDILAVTTMTLTALGDYEVEACSSGPEALGKVEAYQPDLIMLDVMMPEMSGPQTLEALSAMSAAAHIPVLFITASAQPKEVERLRGLGAIDVIVKPYDPEKLCDQVADIWRKYRATRAS